MTMIGENEDPVERAPRRRTAQDIIGMTPEQERSFLADAGGGIEPADGGVGANTDSHHYRARTDTLQTRLGKGNDDSINDARDD